MFAVSLSLGVALLAGGAARFALGAIEFLAA
jgi:hypothetical protein